MSRWAFGWALAGLLACAVGQAASPPDVFVVAQSLDDITSLDPAVGFELSSIQSFTSIYQRLVQPDPDTPAVPRPTLASSWQPGADGHSLTFELRAGARFASGRPVRPEDVIYSLQRAVRMNASPAFILNELGWSADNVASYLRKLDPAHVTISWPAPVGPAFALSILGAPVASIVDQTEVQAHELQADAGSGWLGSHSAGSGPFAIKRYIAHEALVLQANPLSPLGAPVLEIIVIKNVVDPATRRLLLEVGDADMARDLGPDQLAALHDTAQLRILRFPSATLHYLLLNTSRSSNPLLANPALWEAARWLIDYEGLAHQLLKDEFEVHQAFLATGFPGSLNATPYHLDISRARAILAAAHIGPGAHLRLEVFNQSPYLEIAQSLQATFEGAGIHIEVIPELASEVYSRVRARAEEATWLYWIPDYFDAHSTAGAFALNREDGAKTIAWRAGWRIPDLSERTLAAVRDEIPASRVERYRAIQAEVQRSSPFVVALQARSAVAVRANVTGYHQGLDADMVYYDRVRKN
jgi:peptide/nickel transport system substrate-binding protein